MNKNDYILAKKDLIKFYKANDFDTLGFYCVVCGVPLQVAMEFLIEEGFEKERAERKIERLKEFYGD